MRPYLLQVVERNIINLLHIQLCHSTLYDRSEIWFVAHSVQTCILICYPHSLVVSIVYERRVTWFCLFNCVPWFVKGLNSVVFYDLEKKCDLVC